MTSRLKLWLDFESTGKDTNICKIIEIGCFITDDSFIERNTFHEVISQKHAHWESEAMCMHLETGLLKECLSDKAKPESEVKERFENYLKKHRRENETFILAGSSIGFDKSLIETWWPDLTHYFTHKVFDVSSTKQQILAINGDSAAYGYDELGLDMNTISHRALDDIRYSLSLFKWYVEQGYIGKER